MRNPSGRMRRNQVTIQNVVDWTKGTAGSRQPAYSAASAPVRCRVSFASSEDVPDHMRENGVEYLTAVFSDDPGTRARSLVNWIDWSPPKILRVTGPTRVAAGKFHSYIVDCVYYPTKDESIVTPTPLAE
jgi:hypothetical protein